MINILLIDDEPLARSILAEYLESYPSIVIAEECNDGFEGAKAILQHDPDLIFLDVQMPKINGFEMLELFDKPPAVIFTTAFDEFAIRAFEQHAVDYLLKPITKVRFNKAISKFLDQQQIQTEKENTQKLLNNLHSPQNRLERVVVKTGSKIKIIPVYNIIYLSADDDYVQIHTNEGRFLKNKTMAYFEQELDPAIFIRIHRSFIVTIDAIVKLEPLEKDSHIVILNNGDKVPVSKTGYVKLKEVLGI
ncbi:two component transcriptional regulator, LytTR family [bacterium A37T11]|nr:two component transcriptional regulator, LytTR family [bacterium A37T11]